MSCLAIDVSFVTATSKMQLFSIGLDSPSKEHTEVAFWNKLYFFFIKIKQYFWIFLNI